MEFTNDTSKAAREKVLELLRKMTPAQRFRRLCELHQFGRMAMIAGIREQNPNADESEVFIRLVERLHGAELARKIRL